MLSQRSCANRMRSAELIAFNSSSSVMRTMREVYAAIAAASTRYSPRQQHGPQSIGPRVVPVLEEVVTVHLVISANDQGSYLPVARLPTQNNWREVLRGIDD